MEELEREKFDLPPDNRARRTGWFQAGPDYKYALVAKLLFWDGLRISEALKLKKRDLLPDGVRVSTEAGKGGEARLMPLPKWLIKELEEHVEAHPETPYVFYGEGSRSQQAEGKPLSKDTYYKSWRAAVERAGFGGRNLMPHSLRHAAGTTDDEAMGDLAVMPHLESQPEPAAVTLNAGFRAETELSAAGDISSVLDQLTTAAREYAELAQLLDLRRPLVAPDYRAALVGRRMVPWREGVWVAEQERNRLQVGADPIADLFDLIERQGIKVLFADLPEEVSGGYFTAEGTDPCVFLNRTQSLPRVRFTAAHEFAHVLFDRDDQPALIDRTVPIARGDAAEQRANAFAAAFLMPEVGIRRYLNDLRIERSQVSDIALHALSEHFGTPFPVTLYRLQSLRMIDRQRRLDLEQDRPAAVKTRTGRLILAPPQEVPHWSPRFVTLALLAYDRELISLARLAELLDADRPTIVRLVESRGMQVRQGPADRDEALAEARALKLLRNG